MNIAIHAKLDTIPPRFNADAERRIRKALGRWNRSINRVRTFLADENGPRGGPAMRCRVVVDIRRGEPLVATARDVDPTAALADALQRARDRVRRLEERRATKRRAAGARRDIGRAA